jgi:hypothetical protein
MLSSLFARLRSLLKGLFRRRTRTIACLRSGTGIR